MSNNSSTCRWNVSAMTLKLMTRVGNRCFPRAVPLKPIPANIWIWLRHAPCGANPGAKKNLKLSCQDVKQKKQKKHYVREDYGLEPWVRLGWHFTVARHGIISERLIPVIILLQLLHDGKRDGRCHARIQKPHIMSRHSASRLWATDSSVKNVTHHEVFLAELVCRVTSRQFGSLPG